MDLSPSTLVGDSETENEEEVLEVPKLIHKWVKPDSDDELDENRFFDVQEAWDLIFGLPSCVTIMMKLEDQKKLKIEVGANISQEFPWKEIRLKYVYDTEIFDYVSNADILLDGFRKLDPENHLLIGYAPVLTQDLDDIPQEDPFITFLQPDDAKVALMIIHNIEMYENWSMTERLTRKPRPWRSLGSEYEVADMQLYYEMDTVEIEIQSLYPVHLPINKELTVRNASNVRDGYVELIPSENAKFDNITRKRLPIGIQCAPSLITVEQQTDPTFPTNAWSQYVYEIDEADDELDVTSDEEADKKDEKEEKNIVAVENGSHSAPELSDQIKLLLRTLEFNQIDMYRNDYPLVSTRLCNNYSVPTLEETLCFADISKSNQRYVCAVEWYPNISGLLVASYTFSTPCTTINARSRENVVQRTVLEPNPVLMWSFSDNLNVKLEFMAPREITSLSFCPHNTNLLIGGTINGQIVIWDLQDRIAKFDKEEILTAAQQRYREMMKEFLSWAIENTHR